MKLYLIRSSNRSIDHEKAILLEKDELENYVYGIEISSLEELLKFHKELEERLNPKPYFTPDIILRRPYYLDESGSKAIKEYGAEYVLEIYDTYRE